MSSSESEPSFCSPESIGVLLDRSDASSSVKTPYRVRTSPKNLESVKQCLVERRLKTSPKRNLKSLEG